MNYLKIEQFLEYSKKNIYTLFFGGNLKWNL
jgi:hypothetical protein